MFVPARRFGFLQIDAGSPGDRIPCRCPPGYAKIIGSEFFVATSTQAGLASTTAWAESTTTGTEISEKTLVQHSIEEFGLWIQRVRNMEMQQGQN
jgi:hypothetical protein